MHVRMYYVHVNTGVYVYDACEYNFVLMIVCMYVYVLNFQNDYENTLRNDSWLKFVVSIS